MRHAASSAPGALPAGPCGRSTSAPLLLAVALLLGLGAALGCGREATHPALVDADLPPVVGLESFFADAGARWAYKISPDGRRLAWLAVEGTRPALHWRSLPGAGSADDDAEGPGEPGVDTSDTGGAVRTVETPHLFFDFTWARDSRHVLATWDPSGSENTHVLALDLDAPEAPARDLTPYEGVRALLHQVPVDAPGSVLVTHNRRDRSTFDLVRVELGTGASRVLSESPGAVYRLWTDSAGGLVARQRRLGDDGHWVFERPAAESGPGDGWREVFRGGPYENLVPAHHAPPGTQRPYALSNRGRERLALVRLDLDTGREELVYEDPRVDLSGVGLVPGSSRLVSAWSVPGYVDVHFFDEAFASAYRRVPRPEHAIARVISSDASFRRHTLAVSSDRVAGRFYLLDRTAGDGRAAVSELGALPLSEKSGHFAPTRPVTFPSRDGLTLHATLTLPRGTSGRGLPLVVRVHGGPWIRSQWGFDPRHQFLANRGYAVLDVNYRGSRGFGRSFLLEARGEIGRGTTRDLVDAVHWAVEEDIADPEHVAVLGRSFGGFAVLSALTFHPEVFAAGVDVVGLSDLATALEAFPPYWEPWMYQWHDLAGDPSDPEERARLDARSPLHHLERLRSPLLVVQGARDVRVVREQSDRLVEALRERDHPVRYLLFEDEGHAIRRWQNQVVMWRAVEEFLADHLHGRTGPREGVELAARLF